MCIFRTTFQERTNRLETHTDGNAGSGTATSSRTDGYCVIFILTNVGRKGLNLLIHVLTSFSRRKGLESRIGGQTAIGTQRTTRLDIRTTTTIGLSLNGTSSFRIAILQILHVRGQISTRIACGRSRCGTCYCRAAQASPFPKGPAWCDPPRSST